MRCAATIPSSVFVGGIRMSTIAQSGFVGRDGAHQAVDLAGLADHLDPAPRRVRGRFPRGSASRHRRRRHACVESATLGSGPVPATVQVRGSTDERTGVPLVGVRRVILDGEAVKGSIRTLLAVAAAGVAVAVSAAPGSQSRSLAGGTYRVGWESFYGNPLPWAGRLRPDRGVRHRGHGPSTRTCSCGRSSARTTSPGQPGERPRAGPRGRACRSPTNGGTTYTFRLKRGIRFGPPVNREITSADIRYAIERLARPGTAPRSRALFDDIRGFGAYRSGQGTRRSPASSTPNAKTITFNLTRPAGDFLRRLALPAARPIPPEVGTCFEGKPGAYGRDLVSSGPYMIEGVGRGQDRLLRGDQADARGHRTRSSRSSATRATTPRTDSTAARENNPDRFVFVVAGNGSVEIVKKLNAGRARGRCSSPWPKVLGKYAASARRARPAQGQSRRLASYYVAMNLTQPPFDDVHVRRAITWSWTRPLFASAWGGPLAGRIAQHIVPDGLLDGRLEGFAPFRTPGDRGDLARRRAELAKSKYATRNGVCVAKACKRVHLELSLDRAATPPASA